MRTVTVKYNCDVCKRDIHEKTTQFRSSVEPYTYTFDTVNFMNTFTTAGRTAFELCEECYAPIMDVARKMNWRHDT